MSYSRTNPSPRYLELQGLYRTMHEKGERFLNIPPEKTFPGTSLAPQAARIKRLIDLTEAITVLDYGAGKGQQYEPQLIKDAAGGEWPSMMDYWDLEEVVCYDPAYAPFSKLPAARYDGVISTDVLEHCPEEDVPWIVDEIFGYAKKFVFANIACYPASKRLPTGENAHCTIKPVEWWSDIVGRAAAKHPGLVWEAWIQSLADTPQGLRYPEHKIGNS